MTVSDHKRPQAIDNVIDRLVLTRNPLGAMEAALHIICQDLNNASPRPGIDLAQVLLPRGEQLEIVASTRSEDVGGRVSMDDSVSGLAHSSGEPIFANSTKMAVPIRRSDRAVAVVNVESVEPETLLEVHAVVVTTVGSHLISTFSLAKYLRAEARLREASTRLLSSNAPEAAWKELLNVIRQELPVSVHKESVQILVPRGRYLDLAFGPESRNKRERVLIAESFCGEVYRTGEPQRHGDVQKHPLYQAFFGPEINSEMAVPVTLGDAIIGIINIESEVPNAFSAHDQALLEEFATVAAPYLALVYSKRDTVRLLSSLETVLGSEDSETSLEIAIQDLKDQFAHLEPAPEVQVLLPMNDRKLVIRASSVESQVGRTVLIKNSVSGRACRLKEPVLVRDVEKEPEYQGTLGSDIHSELALPIIIGDTVVAIVNLESHVPEMFDESHLRVVEKKTLLTSVLLSVDRLREEAKRSARLENAEPTFNVLGRHAASLMHKVNSPVMTIKGRLGMLRKGAASFLADRPDLERHLDELLKATETIAELPDLLQAITPTSERTDVNVAIELALSGTEIPPGVAVRKQLDDSVQIVHGGSGFRWVIDILINNAIDAMVGLDREKVVSIRSRHQVHFVEITIADTGTGMTDDVRRRAWDPGFSRRRHQDETSGGLGWGMWFVRIWTESALGSVYLDTRLGTGTTVGIRLPYPENNVDPRSPGG